MLRHLLLFFIGVGLVAAAKKKYGLSVKVTMDLASQKCDDSATDSSEKEKPLRWKAARLVIYKEENGWGKIEGTLTARVEKSSGTSYGNALLFGTSPIFRQDVLYEESPFTKIMDEVMSGKTTTYKVQLYIYVDDNKEETPLYFGGPDKVYGRATYKEGSENPYYNTPVRFTSVEVMINDKVVIKETDYKADRQTCQMETTTDWITRAGIYKLAKCDGSMTGACSGHEWLTTYFDPYEGYVSLK